LGLKRLIGLALIILTPVAIAGLTVLHIPGDINRDGEVNFSDFVLLAQNYGQTGGKVGPDSVVVTLHDTIETIVRDTLLTTVHDTIEFTVRDTFLKTVRDTVIRTVHDTTETIVRDTLLTTVHDTFEITVRDTVVNSVIRTVHDTLFVPITYRDTVLVDNTIANAIESKIDGTFEGWDGDTLFPLTNGQIWQQASYAYKYSYRYRPDVVIYYTGVYYKMIVAGVDGPINVKRIK
jgi:hypothetical protein